MRSNLNIRIKIICFPKGLFNAKGDSGQKGNNGDIHMFSSKNCNLVANNEINLELGVGSFGRITLGDPESVNPILKGNQTETLLNDLNVV